MVVLLTKKDSLIQGKNKRSMMLKELLQRLNNWIIRNSGTKKS